jgi:hypothetical protein
MCEGCNDGSKVGGLEGDVVGCFDGVAVGLKVG